MCALRDKAAATYGRGTNIYVQSVCYGQLCEICPINPFEFVVYEHLIILCVLPTSYC